ncbi:MAG: hypothetical protein LBM41_05260, partial [Ruminococcus sp.]|nr:hypothetical protein [Ruminococcus sp.]
MRTSLNLKKITAAVLSLIVCLTLLIGCSKEVPVEPGPKDVIYKFSEFTPKGESYSYLSGVAFYDNTIFVLVSKTEAAENTVLENSYLLKTDLSGEVMEKILLYSEAEGQVEFSFYS